MVLDYLEQQRDAPDQELLDRLNWTDQDLRKFMDRWQGVRDVENAAANPERSREVQDALRSLGLRPPGSTTTQQRDAGDQMRGLQDAGNRRQAPPAYRDAFDAFRRSLSRP